MVHQLHAAPASMVFAAGRPDALIDKRDPSTRDVLCPASVDPEGRAHNRKSTPEPLSTAPCWSNSILDGAVPDATDE
jgi:hypothetical protein